MDALNPISTAIVLSPQCKELAVETTKICSVCGDDKSLCMFYPKKNQCKACYNMKQKARINSNVDAFLISLLATARGSANKRKSSGRDEAGTFSITLPDLMAILVEQDGKCYYSGVPLVFRQLTNWQCSLERKNPSLGYVVGNVALIVCEFQGASQWSRAKYERFIKLLTMDHVRQIIDWNAVKPKAAQTTMIQTTIEGILYWRCKFCQLDQLRDQFYKNQYDGCKECVAKHGRLYRATPRGHINNILGSMRLRSKKKKWVFDLEAENLISIWEAQGGLCAYSGIPLCFGSHHDQDWTCSPERKDITKPYTKENICLICYEFNTADNSSKAKDQSEVSGTSAWTQNKIDFIKAHISRERV